MRFASVIFSTLLYLLPSVLQADTPPKNVDPADKILVRLGEMKTSDQQAWLQGLENRAIRAAKLSMNADEAAVEQKKIQGMLHQKMVTWKILREVMADADAHEKIAIDRLVRRYRGLIFDKFSKDPDALNQHRDAWGKTYLAWKLAGEPFEQHGRLIDWLEQAIQGVESGAMPEEPKFEKQQPLAKEETQNKEEARADEKPQSEKKLKAAVKSEAEQPVKPAREDKKAKVTQKLEPKEEVKEEFKPEVKPEEKPADIEKAPAEEKVQKEDKKLEEEKTAVEPKSEEPTEKPESKEEVKEEVRPEEKAADVEKAPVEGKVEKEGKKQEEEKPADESKPEKPAKSDSDMSKTITPKAPQPPLPLPEAAAQLQERNSIKADISGPKADKENVQANVPQAGKSPAVLARRPASPIPAMPEDRKPLPPRKAQAIGVTAPKVAADAVQQTAALDLPSQTRVALPTLAPTFPEETQEDNGDQASAAPVEIKVEELVSRIDGCNLAFRAIESELDENGHWTIERLESAADRLKILTVRRNDLDLFREALSEDARKSLEKLDSSKGAISQLATRIVEVRRAVFSDNFKGTDSERQNTVQRLDELSRRLAAMVEK